MKNVVALLMTADACALTAASLPTANAAQAPTKSQADRIDALAVHSQKVKHIGRERD